jgi:ribosomal protein L37AE/L43A
MRGVEKEAHDESLMCAGISPKQEVMQCPKCGANMILTWTGSWHCPCCHLVVKNGS